jgi:hypothetical protein
LLQKEGFWSDKIAASLLQESKVAEKSLNHSFLKGLKRQNRFICIFLRVNSIGIALIDSFFWMAPTTGANRYWYRYCLEKLGGLPQLSVGLLLDNSKYHLVHR